MKKILFLLILSFPFLMKSEVQEIILNFSDIGNLKFFFETTTYKRKKTDISNLIQENRKFFARLENKSVRPRWFIFENNDDIDDLIKMDHIVIDAYYADQDVRYSIPSSSWLSWCPIL